ncbi:MAG: hypothetical protein AABY22_32815 [Nanoarchaeota archaeon]
MKQNNPIPITIETIKDAFKTIVSTPELTIDLLKEQIDFLEKELKNNAFYLKIKREEISSLRAMLMHTETLAYLWDESFYKMLKDSLKSFSKAKIDYRNYLELE